jgi:formylglycine-generating enzyme required for sulfatase activity
MKNKTVLFILFVAALIVAGCSNPAGSGGGRNNSDENGNPTYREMKEIEAINFDADIPGQNNTGSFMKGYHPHIPAYSIAKYETTWGLWNEVYEWAILEGYIFETDTTGFGSGEIAATGMTWYDAIVWCNAYTEWYNSKNGTSLKVVYVDKRNPENPVRDAHEHDRINDYVKNDTTAKGFRLPTGVEWEYACRGTDVSTWDKIRFSGSDDIDEVAWWDGNSDGKIHEVGQLKSNNSGLYDMTGNAFEYCWDWWIYDGSSFHFSTPWPYTGPALTDFDGYNNKLSKPYGRVVRGGGIYNKMNELPHGLTYLDNYVKGKLDDVLGTEQESSLGFRVARSL